MPGIYLVANFLKTLLEFIPGLTAVMTLEVGNIFKDDESGLVVAQNPNDVVEQVTPLGTFKALLLASLGEGLAGRARTQNIMLWDLLDWNLSDVTDRLEAEILFVNLR